MKSNRRRAMFAQIHAENRSKLARKFIQHFKEKLLIAYRDFIPQQTVGRGFFSAAEYESFDAALRAANTFVETQSVKMLNVETVVLPNVWDSAEEGTTDASIRTSGDISSTWHQFIRVWYER